MSSNPDLMQRIASAGARMDPKLSNWDVERLVAGARQRRQSRRVGRAIFFASAACLALVALVVVAHRKFDGHHGEVAASHLAAHDRAVNSVGANPTVRLADGSTATPLDTATEITVAQDMTDRATLVLGRGRGRFDVKPRPTRVFVVHAGNVTITVLGTLFTVERIADRVGVSVESGTVQVDWGIGSAVLEENSSGWYPPLVIKQDDRTATDENATHEQSPQTNAPGAASPSVTPKTESAADLLQASDSARISGHAEQAAELLRKLLREHRNDARAPLAAFTLGRMLLMELGRPGEAAHVFAEARRLAPGGPFAEDALAREVEAYNRAGKAAQARAKAEEYLRLYPEGRRAAIVRVMGGIR